MSVTVSQIAHAYEYSQKAYNGELTNAEAAMYLANHYGLNHNTAIDFISVFKHMVNGHEYKRGLSMIAIEYYLKQIVSDYGAPTLENALSAFLANIEYEESIKGIERPGPRRIHARFCKYLNG